MPDVAVDLAIGKTGDGNLQPPLKERKLLLNSGQKARWLCSILLLAFRGCRMRVGVVDLVTVKGKIGRIGNNEYRSAVWLGHCQATRAHKHAAQRAASSFNLSDAIALGVQDVEIICHEVSNLLDNDAVV